MRMESDMRKRFESVLQQARQPEKPDWTKRKFIVYGAGNFGRDVAAVLVTAHDLIGFIDRNGNGQTVCGVPVHNLQSAQVEQWLHEQPVVFVGIHSPAVSAAEIADELRGVGFRDVLTPVEFHPFFQEQLGPRYWLGDRQSYAACANEIEAVSKLFADQSSFELFWETLLFRLGERSDVMRQVTGPDLQYADPSLPRWTESLAVVDGGAFIGDTLVGLERNGYTIAIAHSFEPDLANFRSLKDEVAKLKSTGRIVLWPCGLWDKTERLSFAQGGGAASRLSQETTPIQVPVVALDEVLHNERINLIKLDVEGAELRALEGSRRLLSKQRPSLAVCVYHEPHHLWSIAQWVADLHLDYRLYLRTHQHNGFDTVLYALPK